MQRQRNARAGANRLTVWALALAMSILLIGCGGSDPRDDQPDKTTLPVTCAASAVCTR